MQRRSFILSFTTGVAGTLCYPLLEYLPVSITKRLKKRLRPPGALTERAFIDKCIGCGQCINACPNKCIRMQELEKGVQGMATPVINPRTRGCILCMACTQSCPTGALQPLPATEAGIRQVRMGKAFLSTDTCFSYAGRTCGACYHACPLKGSALTVSLFEKPEVHQEHCVGCGLCEQACIHMPQAIRVLPTHYLEQRQKKAASHG